VRIYTMKRNPQRFREVTLFVVDTDTSDRQAKTRHCLPLVIGSDGWTVGSGLYGVAMTILLHYFAGEIDCERRAAVMCRVFANRLTRLPRDGWKMTETEVNDLVADILVTAADCVRDLENEMIIEEISGERRDLLRRAALQEVVREQ
jgi:hypothetical protein